MDFTMSERQTYWRDRVVAFMNQHVYPAVPTYKKQMEDFGQNRWQVIPVVEELKAIAKKEGLWNLFLPKDSVPEDSPFRGAGLTNLEMFYKARPSDIAEAAGIARELAERIVARFQRYKRELGSIAPAPRKSRDKAQLETLTRKLEEQNGAFDASAKGWSNVDDKRRIRAERAATLLEVTLILARLGEVSLVQELERVPFEKKVEALKRYLSARTG